MILVLSCITGTILYEIPFSHSPGKGVFIVLKDFKKFPIFNICFPGIGRMKMCYASARVSVFP